jgi:serine protease Do
LRTVTGLRAGDGSQIVTNLHVIEGAAKVELKALDSSTVMLEEVYAFDRSSDLVLLFSPKAGVPLKLAGAGVAIGESVAVIGSPFGLEGSLSSGVISALRELPHVLAKLVD